MQEIRIAGWLWLANFLTQVALTLLGVPDYIVFVVFCLFNLVPSWYLGFAAHKLGKSWLLFGVVPAILAPFSLPAYLWLRSDAWIKEMDRDASSRGA